MNRVTVIGSINLDRTIRVKQMPKPGETMHTEGMFSVGGGKGANQAVAAIRNGAHTSFIGAIGNDEAGTMMMELLSDEGIQTDAITVLEEHPTGQAYIVVDENGENSIMIVAGANNEFVPEFVREQEEIIKSSDFLIAQFESHIGSTVEAFKIARNAGVKTILNPAPALASVPQELLEVTDMIVPNETEAEILTGVTVTDKASMELAAKKIHELGVEAVIITIGSKGAYFDVNGKKGIVPAFKVDAVDTTAAGDTFIGAMASVLNKDFSNIEEAILYGNKASSITVQRFGAQPSIPFRDELE